MAETSTIRTAPETETQPQSLTADEQDSLAVGEALVTVQESLLGGKYKNAEELENAYVELQKKLGDNSDAVPQEGNEEAAEEEVAAEETTEETEASKDYNEDGSVNYSQVADTYGSEISGVMEKAGLDPWAISKEFHENQGEYTPEMVKQLTDAGFSESAVKSYFAGRAAQEGYTSSESVQDISESQIGEIQTAVGGKDTYANMISWASQNLTESAAEAFDATMSSGSLDQIRLAVAGLQAQYENATGYDGEMLTGKAVKSSGDVFRSQAELVQAMSDQRYDNDPAYRQDVIAKLDRSNLDF